jgi:hypothetical protein
MLQITSTAPAKIQTPSHAQIWHLISIPFNNCPQVQEMLHLFCKGYPNRIRPKQPIPFLSTLLECLTIFSSTINLRSIEYRPMSSECGRGILARAAEKIGMNSMGRRLMAQNYECTPTRSHVDRKQGACLTISCTL